MHSQHDIVEKDSVESSDSTKQTACEKIKKFRQIFDVLSTVFDMKQSQFSGAKTDFLIYEQEIEVWCKTIRTTELRVLPNLSKIIQSEVFDDTYSKMFCELRDSMKTELEVSEKLLMQNIDLPSIIFERMLSKIILMQRLFDLFTKNWTFAMDAVKTRRNELESIISSCFKPTPVLS